MVQLSHPSMTTGKTIALTRWTFVGKVTSLLIIPRALKFRGREWKGGCPRLQEEREDGERDEQRASRLQTEEVLETVAQQWERTL